MKIRPRGKRTGDTPPAQESPKPKAKKPAKPSASAKKPTTWKRRLFKWLILLAIWCGMAAVAVLGYFAYDLPDTSKLGSYERQPSVLVRSKDGLILGSYGDLYGDYLNYSDIPQAMVQALLATEDRRFFSHFGVDLVGLTRAMVRNYQAQKVVEGGSTLTQQLAKNLFLSSDRTLRRKIQEVLLALWLEGRFTKEEIITIYLNRVYMGAGTFGIDAAARRYFQKPATRLNLPESAMLVGLLKAPSRFSPTNNPELAWSRAKQVLKNMQEAGYMTEAMVKKAMQHPAKLVSYQEDPSGAKFFTDWVVEQLESYMGTTDEDLDVTTTLDTRMQKSAEAAVATQLGSQSDTIQGALVSMTPEGAVLAMVGGRSYRESQFNRATQAQRQPGSSFKVFAYLAMMEAGASPYDIWVDQPIAIGNWAPDNYGGDYKGEMSLTEALAHSTNTIAVQVSETIGRGRWIDLAHRMGIRSDIDNVPSAVLGSTVVYPIEMVNAYAVLANGGRSVSPYAILSIKTKSGKELYKHQQEQREQVLSPAAVGKANQLLSAVISIGTGRAAAFGREAAGKTGTSQEYRDAWFIGYTADVVTGVWIGKDDNTSLPGKTTGGSIPARIWRDYMREAHRTIPPKSLYSHPTDWLDQLLPWNSTPDMQPPPAMFAPNPNVQGPAPAQQEPPTGEHGLPRQENPDSLGEMFNAIIDGNLGDDVEYSYPKPRQ